MDKPRHANFIGLDGYNMSYKYISPRPSVFRRVNLVSSFYIHDRFLKCEIVPNSPPVDPVLGVVQLLTLPMASSIAPIS